MSARHSHEIIVELFGQELILEVDFNYVPYQRATGPTYSSGGEPPCGPEVDVLDVRIKGQEPNASISKWLGDMIHDGLSDGRIDICEFTAAVEDERDRAIDIRAERYGDA